VIPERFGHTGRRARHPPLILASGQMKRANIDVPADSHFFGKPLQASEVIAEMRNLIGHA